MTVTSPAGTTPVPTAGTGRGHGGGLRRAAGWAVAMDSGGQLVNLAVSMLLAALLGPEVFGLVAMALVYVMFIQIVQQQGMQAAVIQREHLTDAHRNGAFWLVMGTSVVLTSVSVLLAGWWAGVNRQPELGPLLVALSLLLPVRGLATVQEALVRRSMRFKPLAVRTLVATVIGGAAGLTGALLGWGVWALVAQHLTTAVVGLVLLWSVSGWKPGLRTSRRALRELVGFSSGSFLSSIAVFVNNRADALLIGLFFGPVVVGVYRLGGKLVETVLAMTIRPVQSVALPELSRHQADPVRFARSYLRLSRMSAWASLPALGALAGGAGALMAVLGDEWQAAEWPLRVLALVGAVRVLVSLNGPVLQARGLVILHAEVSWVAAVSSAAALLLAALLLRDQGVVAQAVGVGVCRAAVYGTIIVAIHLVLLRRASRVRLGEALGALLPAGGAALAVALASGAADVLLGASGAPAWTRLGVACLLGVVGVALFSRALLADAIRRLRGRERVAPA